ELVITGHGVEPVGLTELLQRSDIVSMHAPATADAHHLLTEHHFRQMKPEAIFVNTGRGPTVDEPALIRALQEGWIAAGGLAERASSRRGAAQWMSWAKASSFGRIASRPSEGRPKIARSTPAVLSASSAALSGLAKKRLIEIDFGSRPAFSACWRSAGIFTTGF